MSCGGRFLKPFLQIWCGNIENLHKVSDWRPHRFTSTYLRIKTKPDPRCWRKKCFWNVLFILINCINFSKYHGVTLFPPRCSTYLTEVLNLDTWSFVSVSRFGKFFWTSSVFLELVSFPSLVNFIHNGSVFIFKLLPCIWGFPLKEFLGFMYTKINTNKKI